MTDPQSLDDRAAIEDVRFRFGASLDSRDWDQFASLFTDDVSGDFRSFGVAEPSVDKATIIAMFQASFRLPADELATQQLITNQQVTVTGDTATNSSYLQGHHRLAGREGGDEVTLRARYEDELVRTHGEWKIQKTRLKVISIVGNPSIFTP